MKRFLTAVVALLVVAGVALGADPEGKGAKGGWIVLFDGQNLDAWDDGSGGAPGAGWKIEDGAVVRTERAGYLWSKERFGDFVLTMEFKTEGNSGIFFRTDDPKNCVQTGIEIQVYRPVEAPTRNSCGAVYDCLAPSEEACKADAWNRIRIKALDNQINIRMNGIEIIDMDLDEWTEPGKNPDGSKNKFKTAIKDFKREGHVGLQEHGAKVAFRNVRIKPLEK